MQKLVSLSQKNIIFKVLIQTMCFVGFKILSLVSGCKAFLRTYGIGYDSYKQMLSYKGKADRKKCFIICTGPSLTISDCEKLSSEVTFAMNSIVKVFKKTDFRPTYYGVQDVKVYDSMKEELLHYFKGNKNIFIADRISRKYEVDEVWTKFPLEYTYAAYNRWFNNMFETRFSEDAHRIVYDGFSITMALIQIAVYMGFKEIYLIGADCSFSNPNKLHFAEHGVVDTTIDTARERNLAGYKSVKTYCETHGVKIYNATRGGELEEFERCDLDEVLNERFE